MKEFYKLIIFWLLFVGLYCYKPPLINVNSTEDVPETQKENLRIENGYAVIEMKEDGDFNEYNASLLLDRNESFIFIFNITYDDEIKNYLTLTLNTSANVNSTMISLMCDAKSEFTQVMFWYKRDLIGLFDNSDSMAFELLPDGTLTNNGSNVIPKKFPFSGAEIQEEDGKRRIDFSISWKNKVYGEFMIVSFFFL
uniref:Uncharacterized protein n=1 Tax=Panagrolaimus davidi TaxID=227884 RepID=A0A914QBC5_9BILA